MNYESVDYPVTRLGDGALNYADLKELIIHDYITEIGNLLLLFIMAFKMKIIYYYAE